MLKGPADVAAIDESARAFGLVVDMPEPERPEIWLEHLPALQVFVAMRTQWRQGMGGPTGLDYSVLPLVERRLGLTRAQAAESFPHLQVMERAALRHWLDES